MNYSLRYKLDGKDFVVTNPKMEVIPKYVTLLYHSGATAVTLVNDTPAEVEVFRKFTDDLRKYMVLGMEDQGVYYVPSRDVREDGHDAFQMVHRPGTNDKVIKYTRYDDRATFEILSIEDAVRDMANDDIIINEVLQDISRIAHVPAYQKRKEAIQSEIDMQVAALKYMEETLNGTDDSNEEDN